LHIIVLKIAAMFIILATGLSFGLFPLKVGDSPKHTQLFSYGAAFAGGVFLAAGLVHMLPDANNNLATLKLGFPIAFFIAGLGFLLVFGIEKALGAPSDTDAVAVAGATSPYVLALVLSIHSIIAGISLGAESTGAAAAVIFIAIIGHKGTAAFALSVNLMRAHIERQQIIKLVTIFSVMTPLGIIIGTVMSALVTGPKADIFEGVFDSIAAGTFFYVATLDIISEEFAAALNRRLKFVLLALGFGFMSMLAIWT